MVPGACTGIYRILFLLKPARLTRSSYLNSIIVDVCMSSSAVDRQPARIATWSPHRVYLLEVRIKVNYLDASDAFGMEID